MTRYEEAFFSLENQEKKASRFARLITKSVPIRATLFTVVNKVAQMPLFAYLFLDWIGLGLESSSVS